MMLMRSCYFGGTRLLFPSVFNVSRSGPVPSVGRSDGRVAKLSQSPRHSEQAHLAFFILKLYCGGSDSHHKTAQAAAPPPAPSLCPRRRR